MSLASEPDATLSDDDFELPVEGLPADQRRRKLRLLQEYLEWHRDRFLGYQVNQDLDDYPDVVAPLLGLHSNNVGDTFKDSNMQLHTKWLERNVIRYYAALWGAKPYDPEDAESAWGYVLSMGSSEGNVYGLLNARDYLSGKVLMMEPVRSDTAVPMGQGLHLCQAPLSKGQHENAFSPVAFFSEDTHYSVAKAAHTLAIPTFGAVGNALYPNRCPITRNGKWPLEVPSTSRDAGPGTVDVEALAELVRFFAAEGFPILLILNLGSTFKGAHDDVEEVAQRLRPIFEEHGLVDRAVHYDAEGRFTCDVRNGYWIHVDGALAATYLPFLRMAQAQGLVPSSPRLPPFDFSVPEVSSIVTSGHKYPGAPWPCGVYMTKRKFQLQPPPDPAVIGSPDTTFAGSRNALSAVLFWNFLASHSYQDQVEMIARCERVAQYAMNELGRVDAELTKRQKAPLEHARSPFSLSVRFRIPNADIVRRYSLAHVSLNTGGASPAEFSHLYVMRHVTTGLVDTLVAELLDVETAFPDAPAGPAPSAPSADGYDLHRQVHVAAQRGFS